MGWLLTGLANLPGTAAPASACQGVCGVVPDAPDGEPMVALIVINGHDAGRVATVWRAGERIFLRRADLDSWGVQTAGMPVFQHAGIAYADVQASGGVQARVDEGSQTVHLSVPDAQREVQVLSGMQTPSALPSGTVLGAFLNYDLAAEHTPFGSATSGFVDAGISDDWGLIAASAFGGTGRYDRGVTRLDTYFLREDAARMRRLLIGDGITRNAAWSAPLRFAGVQYGSDFNLRPGYITFPTPGFAGSAAVPSAVELYVNNALRYQSNVDPGPFALTDLPTVTGAGEMRFVIRDPAGVERTVTTPYYVSSQLLRAGLTAYSVEAGVLRRHYGLRSAAYGEPMVSGNVRHGITDAVTGELHGEASARQQAWGAGAAWVWPRLGEFSLAGAVSAGESRGGLGRVGFSRIDERWSFSTTYQRASQGFRQLGDWHADLSPRTQWQVAGGVSLSRAGNLNVGHTRLSYQSGEDVRLWSAAYTVPVSSQGYATAYALSTQSNQSPRTTTVGVTFTLAFGPRQYGSVNVERRDGDVGLRAEVRQDTPVDQGIGYRVAASHGIYDRREGELAWRTQHGVFTGQAVHDSFGASARVLASGGIGHADGMTFASRRIESGFAVVTVPDSPGITVYRENQPAARTDASGRALITDLRAYDENRLSIDDRDLPLSATVSADVLTVVPRYRGAVAARFAIARETGASMTVVLPDGSPLPPAMTIRGAARDTPLLSGYDGQVFITDPVPGERLTASGDGKVCSFTVGAIPPDVLLPALGPYPCTPSSAP